MDIPIILMQAFKGNIDQSTKSPPVQKMAYTNRN